MRSSAAVIMMWSLPRLRWREGEVPTAIQIAGSVAQAIHGSVYNNVRLNSANGYITPKDIVAGRQQEIHAERDRKLEAARQQRQSRQHQAA